MNKCPFGHLSNPDTGLCVNCGEPCTAEASTLLSADEVTRQLCTPGLDHPRWLRAR